MSNGFAATAGRRLSPPAVRAALTGPGGFWGEIAVIAQTGSTNEDMLAAARRGEPEGTVLVAESQTDGRGRLGRRWVTSPGSALACSVLLRPAAPVPVAARGWVPLLAGVAVATAVREVAGVHARLKWPNDVLAAGGKLAGILAEQHGSAIAVGVGLNVTTAAAELPPGATSLALCDASCTDRTLLLAGLLSRLERWYLRWSKAAGDPVMSGLREEYLRLSGTVGREVRVSLPGGRQLSGTAASVDTAGRLLVAVPASPVRAAPWPGRAAEELVAVSAGDVIHVR